MRKEQLERSYRHLLHLSCIISHWFYVRFDKADHVSYDQWYYSIRIVAVGILHILNTILHTERERYTLYRPHSIIKIHETKTHGSTPQWPA